VAAPKGELYAPPMSIGYDAARGRMLVTGGEVGLSAAPVAASPVASSSSAAAGGAAGDVKDVKALDGQIGRDERVGVKLSHRLSFGATVHIPPTATDGSTGVVVYLGSDSEVSAHDLSSGLRTLWRVRCVSCERETVRWLDWVSINGAPYGVMAVPRAVAAGEVDSRTGRPAENCTIVLVPMERLEAAGKG
jgi:hypothetical protein